MIAAIDIGTNSVKLLIVSNRRTVDERVIVTRLGEGVEKTGRISEKAMNRTLEALVGFREIARSHRAWEIRVVGTRVFRAAKNAKAFVERCRKELDLPVRILSGAEEAKLGYLGATGGSGTAAVLDIGGGSAQLIVKGRGKSVDVGAVVVTEAHLHSDPPTAEEIAEARAGVRKKLAPLFRRKVRDLIGIGGTIATAAAIEGGDVHGHRLRKSAVARLRERLASMPLAERRKTKGLDPARADIIVAGLVILEEAMDLGGLDSLRVSTHGLRHGLALTLTDR